MEAEYWVCGRGHKGLIESGTPPWDISCDECVLLEMTEERDRLRAALQRVVDYSAPNPWDPDLGSTDVPYEDIGWVINDETMQIVKAALAPAPQPTGSVS